MPVDFKDNIKKYFKLPFFIIAIVQFLETFFNDSVIFPSVDCYRYKRYYLFKLIVLLAVILFWQFIGFIITKWKQKDVLVNRFSKYFLIYFGIMLLLLILTWPGVWRWDEFSILEYAVDLKFMYWQHWLTSLYYIVSLSIVPFPAGIVLTQIFIISLIVGYIMFKLYALVKSKWVYAVYIPLLFPAVLSNNLYPIRLPLYSYIEVLFFALLIFKFIEKSKVSAKDIALWSFLLALISTWRTEAVFYILAVPLAMIVIFWKRITIKQFVSFFTAMVVMSGAVLYVQSKGGSDDNYFITGIIEPLHGILSSKKLNATDGDLAAIDKVISVELLKTTSGDNAFNYGMRSYTPEDFKNFKKTYYKLVLKNIPSFLSNRFDLLIKTNGMVPNTNINCGTSPKIFSYADCNSSDSYGQKCNEFVNTYHFNHPLSIGLRSWIISIMDCRSNSDYVQTNALFPVFWNSLPCILILIAIFIAELFGKNKVLALIPAIILLKTSLIFATAPADIFMYYLPVLISGYLFGVMWLLLKFKVKRDNQSEKNN